MPMQTEPLTFLFTDIERSVQLWERNPEAMQRALAHHNALLREVMEANHGSIFVAFGALGDGIRVAFAECADALEAATQAQRRLNAEAEEAIGALRVRMALHTCAAEPLEGGYFSPALNRLGRLLGLTYGGQILLTQAARDNLNGRLPKGATLKNLGMHRLKDLQRAENVYQLAHPELPDEFPPLRSLDTLPGNLPQQATSFIGRVQELAEARRALATTRLLTLTGAGGCGKTRLALQVAAELAEESQDGVWLAELAALTDGKLVAKTVALALGLQERPEESVAETLRTHLQSKTALLVLDNCEHLIEDCAQLAEALLRSCPHLRLLVTSREALHIPGEQAWRVPSLSAPDPDDLRLEEASLSALTEYDSVHLFIERARQYRADFEWTPHNLQTVLRICHRLDGIPLALELAAARAKTLSVEQIDAHLDDRFRLLTGGVRTALPRQRTLRALIDWSYDLLTEAERRLLNRLSVFAGGWTLEAAERIAEDASAFDTLDMLSRLAEKSLVLCDTSTPATRYQLLETVRQYGQEKLQETGEFAAIRARHANYFAEMVAQAEPQMRGSEQQMWLERLEMEHDNLRAALDWYAIGDENEAGLLMAGRLWRFWEVRFHVREGRDYLKALLARPENATPTATRAKALTSAGIMVAGLGDLHAAQELYSESLTIREALGDDLGAAAALNNLGNIMRIQGEFAQARDFYLRSLEAGRASGELRVTSVTLGNLGELMLAQGDDEAARAWMEEGMEQFRETGDLSGMALLVNNLGNLAFREKDYGRARTLYEESLAIQRQVGDRKGVGLALTNLGNLACAQGDLGRARTLLAETLLLRQEMQDHYGIAYALEGWANLAVLEGDMERATRLLGAADHLRDAIPAPLLPAEQEERDQFAEVARKTLGATQYAALLNAGRGVSLEEVVTYALEAR